MTLVDRQVNEEGPAGRYDEAWQEAGKKGWVHTMQIATPQREALELLAEELL